MNVNGNSYTLLKDRCGGEKGFILHPLLFTLYVNDMLCFTICDLILYIDDSILLVSGKDVNVTEVKLCYDLESVKRLLGVNTLSLLLGETDVILFG